MSTRTELKLLSVPFHLSLLAAMVGGTTDVGAQPHLFVVDSPYTSATDYITTIDFGGNILQRSAMSERVVGLGIKTDGEYLILPLRSGRPELPEKLTRVLPDGTIHGRIFRQNGDLEEISWFDFDEAGNLYMNGSLYWWNGGDGLHKLGRDGSPEWSISSRYFQGVAYANDSLYVSSGASSKTIERHSPEGDLLESHDIDYMWGGAIDVDEAAQILYLGHQTGEVVAFDIANSGMQFLREFSSGLPAVTSITVDHFTGNVIVTGLGGLVEFDPTGRELLRHSSSAILSAIPATELARASDFNSDRDLDLADLDTLVGAIATGQSDTLFDLNNDDLVGVEDVSTWLRHAGLVNRTDQAAFLHGDIDLDGSVDVRDFNVWNANKFTYQAKWSKGDLNADGAVDLLDFNVWNANKFTSINPSVVPEPAGLLLGLLCLGTWMLRPPGADRRAHRRVAGLRKLKMSSGDGSVIEIRD